MKKIAGWTLIAFMLVMIVLCTSCTQVGAVTDYNTVIKYNKQEYKIKEVQIGPGSADFIRLLYPINDTTKQIPEVVNYGTSDGDDTHNSTVVVLK